MKRSVEPGSIEELLNDEPQSKVVLVERETSPGGLALVNPWTVARKSYSDAMDLSEGVSNVDSFIQANARNRLDIIGRQMKNLQEVMTGVIEDTKLSVDLHSVACNFVKKPGHVYHLYQRPSGQRYFGMLSPEEWQNAPHPYLGSFMLEADMSWTPADKSHDRYEGVRFLKDVFGISHQQALF